MQSCLLSGCLKKKDSRGDATRRETQRGPRVRVVLEETEETFWSGINFDLATDWGQGCSQIPEMSTYDHNQHQQLLPHKILPIIFLLQHIFFLINPIEINYKWKR